MFSIAAINDVEATQHAWQPLAPTKEAQEFRLTQMYHESLLHMQAGEYEQAQKLLQIIVEDPLSLNAESERTASSDPMRQLRFLSFRNLAEAYLKQGSHAHRDALQCFLHAVSIDEKDVTLWNRLGTLACSLDSLNIARWAFEQGLQCSPQHWVCMEKLMEVLMAIGDEGACLSVAKGLLKISPSHPRAMLVKRAIEENVDTAAEILNHHPVMLRGIDKLKPYHYSLCFSKKRKFEEMTTEKESPKRHVLQLDLKEASLNELVNKILEVLDSLNERALANMQGSDKVNSSTIQDHDGASSNDIVLEETAIGMVNAALTFSLQGKDISLVEIHGPESRTSCTSKESLCEETNNSPCIKKTKHDTSTKLDTCSERASTVKDRDASPDEEPPSERRSTRLERIRTRNFDRSEEQENIQSEATKSKVSSEELLKLLEPFILCKETLNDDLNELTLSPFKEENVHASNLQEEMKILNFLRKNALNSGVYHVAEKILEEVSTNSFKALESWDNLFQMEKYVRSASQASSPFCNLFLAEVYMDMTSFLAGELERKVFLEECDYHLSRILGYIAATFPSDVAAMDTSLLKDLDSMNVQRNQIREDREVLPDKLEGRQWSFWARFYWVSGRAHYHYKNCEQAREDFSKCLMILEARRDYENNVAILDLPHCKVDKQISVETVKHKLHEAQIQEMLTHSAVQMLEDGNYSELIELLAPILFTETGKKGLSFLAGKKHASDFSIELTALDMLISACEKCEPKNFNVALQSYCQRMHTHLCTAGIIKVKGFPENLVYSAGQLHADIKKEDRFNVVAEEMKRVSRFLADVDQKFSEKPFVVVLDAKLLGCMQQLLLTVMCHLWSCQAVRKLSSLAVVSDSLEHSEATCLVDSAVSFCRLQHLHTRASIEEQVELLVKVHNLLAERGLCCAGKVCEGGEGVFLKMAIRYFLLLEMKLKATMPDNDASIVDETHSNLNEGTKKEKDCASAACEDSSFRAGGVLLGEKSVEELEGSSLEKGRQALSSAACSEQVCDLETRKTDLGLDVALDQSFFCLYGLNLRGGLESSGSQDGLAVHANTSLGVYQTKEQCAEVFHYLLPYARVCTKACLTKLRKVLKAIKQHFPGPPQEMLENNAIDAFLDDINLDESELSTMILDSTGVREVLGYALRTISPNRGSGVRNPESAQEGGGNEINRTDGSYVSQVYKEDDHGMKSSPYQEVYENLYYLLAQLDEGSASDKWPGFVFTKEGEDFVEQSAKLMKYDLMYNNMRFESWHKLASLFDEEVDLMLNDGSKTCSALEWHENTNLMKRVEIGRRRTRRCLLMSMALAKTSEQERSVHELLALVYYDTLQNVAPSFNQRQHISVRDAAWRDVCQKSLLHFRKALSFRSEWLYFFYLGKLCEKLGEPCELVLQYYEEAVQSNHSAVDPLYRLHASRLKWLCSKVTTDLKTMKVVAKYSYDPYTKERVDALIRAVESSIDLEKDGSQTLLQILPELPAEKGTNSIWNTLFEDGIKALEVCIEGELKHFHKARYRLAQSLYARKKENDVERAKEELGFCFKSNRSLFIINMWEIDGSTKKNRRKMPGSTGARRSYEITMPESSRKFITCLRKYLLFYFQLCEETFDVCTLERAYSSLRVDKKFSLCLADMVHVALGKYIQTLKAAICQFDTGEMVPNLSSKNLLERFFNLFMEHGGSLSDVLAVSLAESGANSAAALSESTIYSYIHRYLHSLEMDNKVEVLESVNEKIKKRFKTPKLVKEICAQVCKHAAIAWCRCLCASLSAISHGSAAEPRSDGSLLNAQEQLVVEIMLDDFFGNLSDFCIPSEDLKTTEHFKNLSRMFRVRIVQASPENRERASCLLKQTFVFYRDGTGPFPAGINLFLVQPGPSTTEDILITAVPASTSLTGVDLSVPRKLLLWAYTLVHGHTCSIAEAVRFCEDQAKMKAKKGLSLASPPVSCQEKPPLKDAMGLGAGSRSTNDDVVEEKEKHIPDEHDMVEGTNPALVCPSDASGLCTLGSTSLCAEDSTQREAKSRTSVFEFVDS